MKKLKLKIKNPSEILTREQLRRVLGGTGSVPCYDGGGANTLYCCSWGPGSSAPIKSYGGGASCEATIHDCSNYGNNTFVTSSFQCYRD